jgi:hypothetical protein
MFNFSIIAELFILQFFLLELLDSFFTFAKVCLFVVYLLVFFKYFRLYVVHNSSLIFCNLSVFVYSFVCIINFSSMHFSFSCSLFLIYLFFSFLFFINCVIFICSLLLCFQSIVTSFYSQPNWSAHSTTNATSH